MKPYKKIIGVLAIVIGFIALVTPFTPGAAWLIFIGLQLLGWHFKFLEKIEQKLMKPKKPVPSLIEKK